MHHPYDSSLVREIDPTNEQDARIALAWESAFKLAELRAQEYFLCVVARDIPNILVGRVADSYIVYCNEGLSRLSDEELKVVIAHEIGHLTLGHLEQQSTLGHRPARLVDEFDADMFAIEFLSRMSAEGEARSLVIATLRKCAAMNDLAEADRQLLKQRIDLLHPPASKLMEDAQTPHH